LQKKLKEDLPYYPLLDIYLKECKPEYNRDTCTSTFIATWFTITKLWKWPRCPITHEWIKKIWYIYTTEYYSAIKKNEILLFAGKWVEMENKMLSEVNQAQAKGSAFSLACGSTPIG
jgi:hypothetical protein